MLITYQSKNNQITDIFKEHTQTRLEGLQNLSNRISEARVAISHQRGRYTVEITLFIEGDIIRGEERESDPLTSFDRALDKVSRQLRKFKTLNDRKPRRGARAVELVAAAEPTVETAVATEPDEFEEPALDEIEIVRTKAHMLKPMTPEEAALQMEMVGHDFYVFVDGESERVGVVYKRRDGGYGLIEPELG